jgi:ATP-dependent Lhr-like helicase
MSPPPVPLSAPTRAWLAGAFSAPTSAQTGAWAAIARGEDTLVVAPTGSGKTLAAFLHAIDRLVSEPAPDDPRRRCRVLYVSPMKALAVDVERNLRSPLVGVTRERDRAGLPTEPVTVGLRTGDTPPAERARQSRRPPDIWITTPESLFLLLTSDAREALRGVDTVILDEVHAVAGTKRGAHLALSLERLDLLLAKPAQRIALSATVSPVEVVADFVRHSRPATIVAPPIDKQWDLQIRVPVDDLGQIGLTPAPSGDPTDPVPRQSIWPHVNEQLVDLIETHRTTLVFANSRGLAERITASINQIAGDRAADRGDPTAVPIARAHHGSVSKEQRAIIEDDLKAGRLPAVVATSSLELGIDMGAIDLVVQVETPPSVASGLQRVGRAGHQVGAVSQGIVFPKYRGDLVSAAVVTQRMRAGQIEQLRVPRTPLDVLAQHIVAMVSVDDWTVDDALALARRTAPFAHLTDAVLESVLDMLSGRYPSDEFAELRPRLVWDRDTGVLTGRPGAKRLAVTSGGTIPDRGLFTVFLVGDGDGRRVGELDEEMVYESRVGDVIALGASSWRIEEITHDRVLVTPAPGQPGRLPFWHGDSIGRPAELGAAVGAFVRGVDTASDPLAELAGIGLDERAAANLVAYVAEQRSTTGHVPSDTTIVVERFRDELGDWRIVIHSPYGAQVHAPWALAIGARLREQAGIDAQVMHADDGIVLRLPDTDDEESARSVIDLLVIDPDEIEALVTAQVGGSALFAARFRECAARALLLPRRRPDRRTPLWQQRQRSAQLLTVAAGHGSFPIVLETVRECLQDVYDVPALRDLLTRIRDGRIRVRESASDSPSPFAQSLLFGYVAAFLYEGDSPLAERRAQALTLDTGLLAELLGTPELRDLLDADVLDEVEAELQRLTPATAISSREVLADALRMLGPLSADDTVARGAEAAWLDDLVAARRAIRVRLGGVEVVATVEDAGRLRDGLGAALPVGLPEAHLAAVADPLGDVVSRYARTHAPFPAARAATALGLPVAVVTEILERLTARGRLVRGEFRPGGAHAEYVDPDVLRRIRRRTIARLRDQIEPVPPEQYAAFLPVWQQVTPVGERPTLRGADGAFEVVEQLAGTALPASTWLGAIVPVRVADAHDGLLDELIAAGDICWWGVAALPGGDGVVALAPTDLADSLRPTRIAPAPDDELGRRIVAALADAGALFFRDLADRVGADGGAPILDPELVDALWDLAWSGWVTNDGWSALRARLGRKAPARRSGRTSQPGRPGRIGRGALPSRSGPPTAAGRWSLVPAGGDPGEGAIATVQALLDRSGVLTRGAVTAERLPGGFAAAYRVLRAMEDAGRCQRTYAIDGLGAAQFALPSTIDRLRSPHRGVVALAATDPANAYGAALAWPSVGGDVAHRPGRKAGAAVVLVDGVLAFYLERGGSSLLAFDIDDRARAAALAALPAAARLTGRDRVLVSKVNAAPVTPEWSALLVEAGFRETPRGLRAPDAGRG